MRRAVLIVLAAVFAPLAVAETVQRIYTEPDPAAGGGIRGSVDAVVTHALAVDHQRVHVYRAAMSDGGKAFDFEHLPVGKYDLVFVTSDGALFEGLSLGPEPRGMAETSSQNLRTRVAAQDAFFNKSLVQRLGVEGDTALVLVERVRDKEILKQSGEKLAASLRRLEVMELAQASDDWQVTGTRHLYREQAPIGRTDFLRHWYVPEIGGVRVIDSVKNLGAIKFPLH